MFKVTSLNQNMDNKKVITSGITFGFIDLELVFKVEMEGADEPLMVSFFLKNDKSKKELQFEIGKIVKNTLTLNYYNPPTSGSCGIATPLSLLIVDVNLLAIMFVIDVIPGSQVYRFSYEFYHGILSVEGKDK